jgi:hypothetical protein
MIYIPVQKEHYTDAILEAEENCLDGTRVLAWVNYLKDLGIKRYHIAEKFSGQWYYITVDVYPDDRNVYWDYATREAVAREYYIDSVWMSYEDDEVVIYISEETKEDSGDV